MRRLWNDTLMLGGENRAVVVGNAQPALMDWASAQDNCVGSMDAAAACERRMYIAGDSEARGILEGLRAFGFLGPFAEPAPAAPAPVPAPAAVRRRRFRRSRRSRRFRCRRRRGLRRGCR